MFDPFENDHSYWTPYADFLAGVAMIFLVVAALMLLHLTNPSQNQKVADVVSPGTVTVEAYWKQDADVDLWLKSPDDLPVGYSRKSGKYFDLLRDDLGRKFERSGDQHHENAYSRNAPEGEYIVNLFMYSNNYDAAFPIEVEVVVEIVKPVEGQNTPVKKILRTTVQLTKLEQEVTVVRFRLDADAELVPDSINHNQTPLRARKEKS